MAYASLVSLQQTTHLVLNHPKFSIYVDEREIITSIHEYVIFLISFLENLTEKANRLEGKIRALANKAEDLIECFMLNRFQFDRSVGLSGVEFGGRLKRVREEIGSIIGDVMDDRLCGLRPAAIPSSGQSATSKNDVIVGLDEDLIAIKGRLCGQSSKLEVIPIVGMGGIGKTTLARYAYDDPLIREHFYIRALVQVSQDYSAKEFLSNLLGSLKSIKVQMIGEMNESEIAAHVYKILKGRRYVILMDDIWSTEAWDEVRSMFPDDNNGSRIMLTTRLSDVAVYASSGSPLHKMNFMGRNQSWNLLQQKLFANGEDCPLELKDIGKEIAGGCRGLPLAVVLVAGVLSTIIKTRPSWEKIVGNVNSAVDGQLDMILSLSYRLLPHHLRPCFLFMAGFPEDHSIQVWRLVKLWVAEGFLRHDEHGCKSLEDEAEECLEDLVKRNLVLITSRKSNGKIKSCSLHDLVRDMCIRKAQEEKFLLTDRHVHPNGGRDERRISIGHSRLNDIWPPTIHTILCFQTILGSFSLASLVYFRLLRVLDLALYMPSRLPLPSQLFELFHLRYLALSYADSIPSGISKLEYLQTLIICSSTRVKAFAPYMSSNLPLEIWRMPHLRHLVFTSSYHTLPYPEDGSTFPLENLQTLSGVANFACGKRILKMIPNLKKLGFSTFEKHHDLCKLVNLHQLEKLTITMSWSFTWQGQNPSFPRSLKKLSLVGGRLPWKDMSIVGSLPNLQVLKLKDNACDGDAWETIDGGFPELKFLLIKNSNLRHWITETDHFPRLESLVLQHCKYLQEIPDSIGEISTLKVIEVSIWNDSLLNSAKQIQEDQQNYGNDTLQVLVI